eukprot:418536_1
MSNQNIPSRPYSAKSSRRKSKIFHLFQSSPSNLQEQQSLPTTVQTTNIKRRNKHHRSQSTISQFNRLKSVISNLFPKKSIQIKPKRRNSHFKRKPKPKRKRSYSPNPNPNTSKSKSHKTIIKRKKQRSKSFTFRRKKKNKKNTNKKIVPNPTKTNNEYFENKRIYCQHKKTNSCQINMSLCDWIHEEEEETIMDKPSNTISIHPTLSSTNNILLNDIIEEDIDIDIDIDIDGYISDDDISEEYKGFNDMPFNKPRLLGGPKSMRSFEKRPEYITYYPPASLMDVFSNITVDEEERSVTVETKNGIKTRIDAVDQLFELASMTLDYSKFYGYTPDYEHENINININNFNNINNKINNKFINVNSNSNSNTFIIN